VESGNLVFKLNSFLPPDIAIFDIFPVADNAHARFDAVARTYQYHVSDRRLPFRQGQYCRIYYRPDIERMNEAARVLMEYEDFTSFAKLHTQVKTNICHLTKAEWTEEADGWVFTIRSNRFLRNMVRSVTGTLLDVGRGKLSIEGLREIIEKKDRCAAGTSMPACGLFLTKVEYPEGVLSFKL
jgi:tRNA pseudouridine38-40 synthase